MIIFSGIDKKRIVDLLRQNLQAFIFPGVSQATRDHIESHFRWMEQQASNLHITCRLETFPTTKTTEIHISASYKE